MASPELEDSYENQPETQPIGTESFPMESSDDECQGASAWGWLNPTVTFNFKQVALIKNEYFFGKLNSSDVVIDLTHVKEDLSFFNCISKTHFRVFKEAFSSEVELVNLEDLSFNGTYVNKKKVGKGNKVVLKTGDEISLAHANSKVYTFFKTSNDINSWIPAEMQDVYSVIGALGSGAYGEVRLAKHQISGKFVAIKKIKKKEGKEEKIYNEVRILQELKHPLVVSMENVFETEEYLYIVLDYVQGGELAARIREAEQMSDAEAKALTYQLVLALEYLHHKGVAHRDLKPENVLLSKNAKGESIVKVSDFGLSKLLTPDTNLKTVCGTPLYTAPEVLLNCGMGSYTHQVDVWSLGVIIFYCISGKLPFRSDRGPMTVVEQIVRGNFSMRGPEWRSVSTQASSLIRKMLIVDPEKRITVSQILCHPWLKDEGMRSKVQRLITEASQVGDENFCPEVVIPQVKRARLSDEDTLLRS